MSTYEESHQQGNIFGAKTCRCGHTKSDHKSRGGECEWHDCLCKRYNEGLWDESFGIKDLAW